VEEGASWKLTWCSDGVITSLATATTPEILAAVLVVLLPIALLLGWVHYARQRALEHGFRVYYGRPNKETMRKGAEGAAGGGIVTFLLALLIGHEPLTVSLLYAAVWCIGGIWRAFYHIERP